MEGERHGFHEGLVERFGERWGAAIYILAAYFTGQPLLFPSLGHTAFLFFEQPMAEMSSPRNTLIGHLVAVLMAGVVLLTAVGWAINRASGVPTPVWSAK